MQAVFFCKRDGQSPVLRPQLFARHLQHAVGKVDAHKAFGLQHSRSEQGEVAGSRRHVQHALRRIRHQAFDSRAPPAAVNAKRKRMVEQIIGRRNVVEHLLHLLALRLVVVVGLYGFLFVGHGFF